MIHLAAHLESELKKNNIPAFRHKNSITVVVPKASENFVNHYKLAPFGDYMHIICSAHNTLDTISNFIYALIEDYALNGTLK